MGSRLLDALAWVDHQSVSTDGWPGRANGEYLIRVEKDEALPKIDLTPRGDTVTPGGKVTIRLRGLGGEKILSYNKKVTHQGTNDYHRKDIWGNMFAPMSRYSGLISLDRGIGAGMSMNKVYSGQLTLVLEKDISFNIDLGTVNYSQRPRGGIDLHQDSKLVMLEGSKISGGRQDTWGDGAICFREWNGYMPSMYMFGGIITDNITNNTGTIYVENMYNVPKEVFIKKGGAITGNKNISEIDHNKVTVYRDSKAGGNLVLDITSQSEEYCYPPND
jgi:hypothetical protein